MALLTKEEALKYLHNILSIQDFEVPNFNDKSTSVSTKLSFLEKLIRSFLEQEPFQSICLMSVDINKRRRPHWDEIKNNLLAGRGGLCYWLNSFMYALLTAFELNASMTYCTFNVGLVSPNNHLLVLVHDLVAPGSLHLVDVGVGYYFPRPISLDFTTESPEFTDSFMTYKFWKKSDNLIFLLKRVLVEEPTPPPNSTVGNPEQNPQTASTNQEDKAGGDSQPQKNLQEAQPSVNEVDQAEKVNQKVGENEKKDNKIIQNYTWNELYYFNPLLAHKELEKFFHCFDICFSDITKLSTHTSPRVMCWRNGRFLALVNSKLIQEIEDGKLTKTTIVDVTFKPNPFASSQCSSNSSNICRHKTTVDQQDNGHEIIKKPLEEITPNGNINCHNESGNCKQDNCTISQNGTVIESNSTEDCAGKCPEGESQNQLVDLEPLVKAYERHFPRLTSESVRAALKNWSLTGSMYPTPQHMA